MGNAPGKELKGKVVLLEEDCMNPDYRARKWRLFYVTGGFGASPELMGTALIGIYLQDGERTRRRGYHVEAIVADSLAEYDGFIHPSIEIDA